MYAQRRTPIWDSQQPEAKVGKDRSLNGAEFHHGLLYRNNGE